MEFKLKFDSLKSLSAKKLFCIAIALLLVANFVGCPLDVLASEVMNKESSSYYGFNSYTNGDASYTNGDASYTNGDATYTNGDAIYTDGDATDDSNKCGDNVYWSFDETTSQLVISGEGAMWDYHGYDSPFYCNMKIESVVFEKGVTSVGSSAFQECYYLKSVSLSDSITSIGSNAFTGCCILDNIKLPSSVTSIGEGAFSFTDIKTFTIPDGVKAIGDCTFQSCSNLTEVIIPDSVTSIGYCAFSCCSNLKKLVIPESVTFIDEYAFEDCFNLESIIIPDGVKFISNGTFSGCSNLTEIIIPNSVIGIGDSAFIACGFSSVLIPNSVRSIGNYAFNACYELTSIKIPDGVKVINGGTFSYCMSLSQITIPAGVTVIDEYAFSMCNLTDVYYKGNEAQWKKIAIKSENECLSEATIHFSNCSHSDTRAYPQKNATCTENGYTASLYCNGCDTWLVTAEIIPSKGHTFSDWVVAEDLMCDSAYKKLVICSCGVVEEVVVASGHIDVNSDKKCDNCAAWIRIESEPLNIINVISDVIDKLINNIKRILSA